MLQPEIIHVKPLPEYKLFLHYKTGKKRDLTFCHISPEIGLAN